MIYCVYTLLKLKNEFKLHFREIRNKYLNNYLFKQLAFIWSHLRNIIAMKQNVQNRIWNSECTCNILTHSWGGCSCNFSALAVQSEVPRRRLPFCFYRARLLMVFGSEVASRWYSTIVRYFNWWLIGNSSESEGNEILMSLVLLF